MRISLGAEVKDIITGFRGVVTGRVEYLTGCNQVLVQPRMRKDGSKPEGEWLDEQRMVVVGKEIISLNNSDARGFDRPAPRR